MKWFFLFYTYALPLAVHMEFTYNTHEKLKSKKGIEKLFSEGKSVSAYPLRMVYVKNGELNKVGVSVSKRNFKLAVDRNRIKRLLREAYRLNKNQFIEADVTDYSIMILFINKDFPDFELVNEKTKKLFCKFIDQIAVK